MVKGIVIAIVLAVLAVSGAVYFLGMNSDNPDATASFEPKQVYLDGEYVDWTLPVSNQMGQDATIEARLTKERGEKNTIYFTDSGQKTDSVRIGSIASGQEESETFRVYRNQTNDATVEVSAELVWVENNSVLTTAQGEVELSDMDSQ